MAVEIEVDPHRITEGEVTAEPVEGAVSQPELVELSAAPVGWTPEQAGQFICSIWNIGCLIYGPRWAADPRETAGWDAYAAQLLDQMLPRGMGGAVELGVGLVMIGNGLAMMTMRRWEIVKAGPKPIWIREQSQANAEQQQPSAPAAAQPPTPSPEKRPSGPYVIPGLNHEGTPEERSNGWAL